MSVTLEEHIGYLSDAVRMNRFRQAIAQAVRPDDVVVDLGCGFAPLGLMCLQAGAARVFGIDRTDAIEIARESAARAGFDTRYLCIRDSSFRTVLPEPADVAICDHVGYFGFDYGLIAILADARRRMVKPGGRIIPEKIVLKVAGVNSEECRAKAFAWSDSAIPDEFRWLESYAVNAKHTHCYSLSELVTAEAILGEVDLAADCAELLRFTAGLTAAADAELDGLGGWFDCEIAAGVRMTNSPLAAEPIHRDQVFLPFARPLAVRAGEALQVSLSFRTDNSFIAWTARNSATGEQRRQSTWASLIISAADRAAKAAKPAVVSRAGEASRKVLALIDGTRSAQDIEDMIVADCPELLPSEGELRKFVQTELARLAQ